MSTISEPTKQHPILFSGPMVRAILEGRKTQTRRVVKPQVSSIQIDHPFIWGNRGGANYSLKCPYGKPGDRLYVKESFRTLPVLNSGGHIDAEYLTDSKQFEIDGSEYTEGRIKLGITRTGRFAPKWASRILLEVVSVRCERLHCITHFDIIQEGIEPSVTPSENIDKFEALWRKINDGRDGTRWDANPYVWAVEFKVLPNGN